VSRYGELLQTFDLATAYKRAGQTFRGAMEQYFVLLTEEGFSSTGANQQPLGQPSARGGRGGRGRPARGGVKRSGLWDSRGAPTPKKTNT